VSPPQWEIGTDYYHEGYNDGGNIYPRADQVTHNGADYACILANTAAAANEPGVGVSWETYWEISYRHYTEDEDNYYDLDGEQARGYNWKLCPFSTEWNDRYGGGDHNSFGGKGLYAKRTKVGNTITTTFYEVAESEQTTHSGTGGRMRFDQRGSVAGWVCDDTDCYYYTTVNPNKKFFQV
jgi:hypothetical protein